MVCVFLLDFIPSSEATSFLPTAFDFHEVTQLTVNLVELSDALNNRCVIVDLAKENIGTAWHSKAGELLRLGCFEACDGVALDDVANFGEGVCLCV